MLTKLKCSLSDSQALFGCLFLSRSLIEHLCVLLRLVHVLPLSFLDEGSFFELLESNQMCTSHCTPLRVLVKFLEFNFFICCIVCCLWVLLLHKLCSSSSNNLWFVLLLRLRAPALCHLLFARKLLQFVVFSPQVERARAPLFSLTLGSFCNLWFLSSGWESKSLFAISLFARKLLQFLVFSPQVERAPAPVPSPFARKLLLLGHYHHLC